jgi:hypothetical protein
VFSHPRSLSEPKKAVRIAKSLEGLVLRIHGLYLDLTKQTLVLRLKAFNLLLIKSTQETGLALDASQNKLSKAWPSYVDCIC